MFKNILITNVISKKSEEMLRPKDDKNVKDMISFQSQNVNKFMWGNLHKSVLNLIKKGIEVGRQPMKPQLRLSLKVMFLFYLNQLRIPIRINRAHL